MPYPPTTVTCYTVDDPSIVELAEHYEEGDLVVYDDEGHAGVVVAPMDESFTWPTGEDDEEEVEASSDEPAYVVARETGGSAVFAGDELDPISGDEAFGDTPENPEEDLEDAEMAEIYAHVDDPFDPSEFVVEEMLDIPGVDDPGIGFSDWPPSWEESEKPARLIALDAWTSLGATFTTCVAEMTGDISRPKRFCAAFKDTILGTERWRNKF